MMGALGLFFLLYARRCLNKLTVYFLFVLHLDLFPFLNFPPLENPVIGFPPEPYTEPAFHEQSLNMCQEIESLFFSICVEQIRQIEVTPKH